jgi:hypothetical protein
MPILGVVASSISGNLELGSFESIATQTPSGVNSFSFNSIPSTYKHLQLRYITSNTTAAYYVIVQFNSDTASNYTDHQMTTNGSTVITGNDVTNTGIYLPRNSASSTAFAAGVVDVLDYSNTSKTKVIRGVGGYETNFASGASVDFMSGSWQNTAAINSIRISVFADNFRNGSHFALYGIKG